MTEKWARKTLNPAPITSRLSARPRGEDGSRVRPQECDRANPIAILAAAVSEECLVWVR